MVKKIKERKENQGYQGLLANLSAEKTDSFELIIKDGISSFERLEPEEELSDDHEPEIIIVNAAYSEENVSIYKNLSDKTVTELKDLLGCTYSISHPLQPYSWKVTSVQKDIMGLKAYKAAIGDSITAWFCPSIPVQDGPGLYYGLPGLILDLEDPHTLYLCTALNTQSKREVDKAKQAKAVTPEEYERLRQRALNRER